MHTPSYYSASQEVRKGYHVPISPSDKLILFPTFLNAYVCHFINFGLVMIVFVSVTVTRAKSYAGLLYAALGLKILFKRGLLFTASLSDIVV